MDSVVHFEIPADDVARAEKFYKNLFGWDIHDSGMPGMQYLIVHTGETDKKGMLKKPGAINGGMMKRSHPGETPVLVIDVKNLDAKLKEVVSEGGKIVMPTMEVGKMGLYAKVTDPEGNVIGIWQDILHP